MAQNLPLLMAVHVLLYGCFAEPSESDTAKPSAKALSQGCSTPSDKAPGLGIRGGDVIASSSDYESEFHTVGKLIVTTGSEGSLCTGTLIAPNFVLTADHCVKDGDRILDQFTFQQNDTYPKLKASTVFVYDQPGPFRDIALVKLNAYYDETINYPRIMKHSLPPSYLGKSLRMVGFGGYTDNQTIYSYTIGSKRTGEAIFAGYEVLDTEFFGANVDFLSVTPGDDDQLICQGDSGSALFYTQGPHKLIVGITSIGEFDSTRFANPNNGSPYEKCHYGTKGYFVPSHKVYSWIYETIKKEEPNYRDLDANMLATGTIVSVTQDNAGNEVVQLSNVKAHDISPGLVNNEYLINQNSTLLGSNYVGRKVLVYGNTTAKDTRPTVTLLADLNFDRITKDIEISGVVASDPVTVDVFGRTESYIKLDKLNIKESFYDKLPVTSEFINIVLCTQGCSMNIDIDVSKISKGDRIDVKGDYILGKGFYARTASGTGIEQTTLACAP